jgi:predicted AAA+ superfamily ATPase
LAEPETDANWFASHRYLVLCKQGKEPGASNPDCESEPCGGPKRTESGLKIRRSGLEAWYRNRLKRLVKTPKLHFLDSGLLVAILGITEERIGKDRSVFSPLLETFAFAEVMKQVDWLARAGFTTTEIRIRTK